MAQRRSIRWLMWSGLVLVGLPTLAVMAAPTLLRPLIEHEASAALGRQVIIDSVHLQFGNQITVVLKNLVVGNPEGFPAQAEPFARIAHLSIRLDVLTTLRRRQLAIGSLELDRPLLRAIAMEDGQRNFIFPSAHTPLRRLRIVEGHAHVTLSALRANVQVNFGTQPAADPNAPAQIIASAQGTYAGEPVTAHLTGSAAIETGPSAQPWPFDLQVENGQTKISAKGLLQDPTSPRSAKLRLIISGPDMALLRPLIGVSFPPSPAYTFDGGLDYAAGVYRVTGDAGTIGRSDVEGQVTVLVGNGRSADITAALRSRHASFGDIASLLRGGQAPAVRAEAAQGAKAPARTDSDVFPQTALNLPQLDGGALHLTYAARQIEAGSTPFTDLTLHVELAGGGLALQPVSLEVGDGRLSGNLSLSPDSSGIVRAQSSIRLDRVDVARLMRSTGYHGTGALSGTAHLQGAGKSVAAILGTADGEASFWMENGDLSALLVDFGGLRLGSALLSSLANTRDTPVDCFVADLPLRHGILSTRGLILETANAVTVGSGIVDLARERVDLRLRTQSRHFTIGVLPGPLLISGTLADPSVAPDPAAVQARGSLAEVISILPGVQFGVDNDPKCGVLMDHLRSRTSQ